MRHVFLFLLSLFICSGCAMVNKLALKRIHEEHYAGKNTDLKRIDFCALPNHTDRIVRIRAIYSGVEEYWSLAPVRPCPSGFGAEHEVTVEFIDGVPLPWAFVQKHRLDKVHERYHRFEAIVDIEGYYESGREGYGHLGSYPSQFVITYLHRIKLVEPQKAGT